MLKSPIKLSTRPNSRDYQLSSGVTQVQGVPIVDANLGETSFVNGDIDGTDEEFDLTGHGFAEGDPITFREGGTLPSAVDEDVTYFVVYVDADHFGISLVPGSGTKVDLTANAVGTNYIQKRKRAKYVLLTNYGSVPIGIRPTEDNSYAMNTNNEFVLRHDVAQPIILNVTGSSLIAAESIGGDGDLRVVPLENE